MVLWVPVAGEVDGDVCATAAKLVAQSVAVKAAEIDFFMWFPLK